MPAQPLLHLLAVGPSPLHCLLLVILGTLGDNKEVSRMSTLAICVPEKLFFGKKKISPLLYLESL